MTDEEAISKLLPDAKFAQDSESGEVGLALDGTSLSHSLSLYSVIIHDVELNSREIKTMSLVRLKRFPVQKSFWEQISEASRRGDSMGESVSIALVPSFQAVQQALGKWFFTMMADRVVERFDSEVESLGVYGGGRRNGAGLGLNGGNRASKWGGIRWEMGTK